MKKLSVILLLAVVFALSSCEVSYNPVLDSHLRPGLDTVIEGGTYTDPGAYVLDDTLEVEMDTSDVIDTSVLGTQTIVYTLTYDSKSYELTRYVKVVPDARMMFDLLPGIDTVYVNDTWVDAGVDVDDSASVTVFSDVDTTQIGTYHVIYEILHEGLTYHVSRVVHVIDAI